MAQHVPGCCGLLAVVCDQLLDIVFQKLRVDWSWVMHLTANIMLKLTAPSEGARGSVALGWECHRRSPIEEHWELPALGRGWDRAGTTKH